MIATLVTTIGQWKVNKEESMQTKLEEAQCLCLKVSDITPFH